MSAELSPCRESLKTESCGWLASSTRNSTTRAFAVAEAFRTASSTSYAGTAPTCLATAGSEPRSCASLALTRFRSSEGTTIT